MKKIIVTLAVCLLGFSALTELRAQTQQVSTLTSAQYASMKKDDVYVIMFTMKGCLPCVKAKKTLLPVLADKFASENNVHVYLFPVDTDAPAPNGTSLHTQLGIRQAPAFVVLYNDTPMYTSTGFEPNGANKLVSDIVSAVARVK